MFPEGFRWLMIELRRSEAMVVCMELAWNQLENRNLRSGRIGWLTEYICKEDGKKLEVGGEKTREAVSSSTVAAPLLMPTAEAFLKANECTEYLPLLLLFPVTQVPGTFGPIGQVYLSRIDFPSRIMRQYCCGKIETSKSRPAKSQQAKTPFTIISS